LLENQKLADDLTKLLTNTELIRFGGATSRGLGKVRFTAKNKNAVVEVKKILKILTKN
jgi:CRISPR/Cas system CSM-associated protein Csm3 (group 7 of RAMP superfamily)